MRALVVDDSRAMRTIICADAARLRLRRAEAVHGKEALTYLEAAPTPTWRWSTGTCRR